MDWYYQNIEWISLKYNWMDLGLTAFVAEFFLNEILALYFYIVNCLIKTTYILIMTLMLRLVLFHDESDQLISFE